MAMTVDCVPGEAAGGHDKRVTITPGTGNFLAISVKLSGSRPAFPIRVEIRAFDCAARTTTKDNERTKPMQSTLALSRYGWLNTVYEISRMQALVPEMTEPVPVERCFAPRATVTTGLPSEWR
jgi:hypothetical protein